MIPSFLLENENRQFHDAAESNRLSFIDKTIKTAASFFSTTLVQWLSSGKKGFFQSLDSRVKTFFMIVSVVLVSVTGSILCQFMITGLVLLLCLISGLPLWNILKRALAVGFIFGFLIFLPASLNVFTRGDTAFTLFHFVHPHSWWIYHIPRDISVTYQGMQTVLRLTIKITNSVSLVLLVLATTTFEGIVKSLSFFRIPGIFLLTLTLTYRFVYLLSLSVVETYRALKMRWWSRLPSKDAEAIVAGRAGYIFRKCWERYELVYQSMIARGFNGSMNAYYFNKLSRTDYLFILVVLLLFCILILINHVNALSF